MLRLPALKCAKTRLLPVGLHHDISATNGFYFNDIGTAVAEHALFHRTRVNR